MVGLSLVIDGFIRWWRGGWWPRIWLPKNKRDWIHTACWGSRQRPASSGTGAGAFCAHFPAFRGIKKARLWTRPARDPCLVKLGQFNFTRSRPLHRRPGLTPTSWPSKLSTCGCGWWAAPGRRWAGVATPAQRRPVDARGAGRLPVKNGINCQIVLDQSNKTWLFCRGGTVSWSIDPGENNTPRPGSRREKPTQYHTQLFRLWFICGGLRVIFPPTPDKLGGSERARSWTWQK